MASSRPKGLLLKIETVYGTNSLPVPATDGVRIMDDGVKMQPLNINYIPLSYAREYMGTDEKIVASYYSTISFVMPLPSSGSPLGTVPKYGPTMRACGMRQVVTATTKVDYLDDVDENFESATIIFDYAGKRHIMVGAMGKLKGMVNSGDIMKAELEFTGLCSVLPADQVFAAIDLTAWRRPVAINKANTTCSLHSYNVGMYDLSFDLGNTTPYTNIPGIEDVTLIDRDRSGSITIRDPLIAQKNYELIAVNATLGPLLITHGTVAGDIIEIGATDVALESPDYGDKDKVVTRKYNLRFNRMAKANPGIRITAR